MRAGILYNPLCLEHHTGRHPENAARLTTTLQLLQERGLWDRLPQLPSHPDPLPGVQAVHEGQYLALLQHHAARGGGFLTADTPFGARSWDAALAASAAAMGAVDAVLGGEVDAAFALIRPPGHHACPGEGMGFCLLNHAAVAARHAVRSHGLSRVLVMDFDVHHGNGTQDAFYEDPTVLYFSTHQYPAYPGTGAARELGSGKGLGTTVNVPLPGGVGDEGFAQAFERVLVPIAREYRPELILVSAGYDAHWRNGLYLNGIHTAATVAGIAHWVSVLKGLAEELCGGRLAFCLEGGYDPEALAWSVDATFRVLLEEAVEDPIGPPPRSREPHIDDILDECRRLHHLEE